MSELWRRLQQACERLRPHLPRGGLNPPATEAQIRTVEALVGYRFPDDLREAYLHFNGSSVQRRIPPEDRCPYLLLPYFDWLDLSQMASTWVMLRQIEDDAPFEDSDEPWTLPQRPGYGHPAWLPVGGSNTAARLVVDLDPTRFGRVGQVLSQDIDIEVVAPSLKVCLERLVDAFERGLVRWDEQEWQWVDAAGTWVHDLALVAGPWPALVPGGTSRRLETAPQPLPPAPVPPAAFELLCTGLQATLAALLPAGRTMPARGAHAELIGHAEAVFGRRLPWEAVACWRVLDGARPHQQPAWFSVKQATLTYRQWSTWAALEGPLAEGPPSADGCVQPGPWRAGWFPVGENIRTLLCLDLDPAGAGTVGQLIEIELPIDGPWAGRAPAAPRRIADGLALWLWQLAHGAVPPADLQAWPAAEAWRALQRADTADAAPAEEAWSPRGWEPDPAVEGPLPLFPRRWTLFKKLQHVHPSYGVRQLASSNGPGGRALAHMDKWASGRAEGRMLVIAPIGAGTTSLLRSGFARMRQAWQQDPRQPMPLLVDAALHAGVTSLQALLDAEAARRGASAQGLVQALAAGHCALIVDHVEALPPAWPGVWTACDVVPGAAARIMFVCASEVFGSLAALRQAFEVFSACDAEGRRSGCLAVHDDDPSTGTLAQRRCRQLGLKVHAATFREPNPLGDLDARLGFFVLAAPWLVKPPAGDPQPAALHAWWRWLAARQPHCSADTFITLVLEALVVCWQPTTPLPCGADETLRPWLCAALGARAPEGEIRYDNGVRTLPLLHAMAQDDDAAVVTVLQRLLVEHPSKAPLRAADTGLRWFALGHTEAWRGAARLLLQPQTPPVAGFLLALGCALAWPDEAGLSQVSQEDFAARFEQARRLTLPQPLSLARTAGADLRGQDFHWAPLAGVDLRGACLDGTIFTRAQLQGAQLDGASMRGTWLGGAQLQGATLHGARAVEANFRRSNLCDVAATGFTAEACDLRDMRWNARWPGAHFVRCRSTDGIDPALAEAPHVPLPLTAQALPPWRCTAVSPCGRWLAIGGAERSLSLHDAATLQPHWCVRVPEGQVVQLGFDADGSHVAALLEHGEIGVWATATPLPDGRERRNPPGSITLAEEICELRFDPAEQALASLSRRGVEWYRNAAAGGASRTLQLYSRQPCRWTAVAFAGPPALLVVASEHGVETVDPQGAPENDPRGWKNHGPRYPLLAEQGARCVRAVPVRWAPAPADAVALSSAEADTALLAVRAGGLLLLGPLVGEGPHWQAPLQGPGRPQFSRCGRWVCCGEALFEVASGQRHPLPGPALSVLADGRLLVASADGGRLIDLPA